MAFKLDIKLLGTYRCRGIAHHTLHLRSVPRVHIVATNLKSRSSSDVALHELRATTPRKELSVLFRGWSSHRPVRVKKPIRYSRKYLIGHLVHITAVNSSSTLSSLAIRTQIFSIYGLGSQDHYSHQNLGHILYHGVCNSTRRAGCQAAEDAGPRSCTARWTGPPSG